MRLRVYIAGPISRGDLAQNINQATAAFVQLAKAGFAPFCPHWSAYCKPCDWREVCDLSIEGRQAVMCEATVQGNDEMTHADWIGIDLSWVGVSDALLRLPGDSRGADQEVAHAEALGIPVFYSVDDVLVWKAKTE